MGKEFVEYQSNTNIPYSVNALCFCLTQYARNYIKTNREFIADVSKDVRDAVLVDAINFLGLGDDAVLALNIKKLYSERIDEEKVDAEILLTTIQYSYAIYLFHHGVVESVLKNSYRTNCQEKFDVNDGAKVLVDFINYIAEVNGYDRKFTIKDLYEKYKDKEYEFEMEKLKKFLEKSSEYSAQFTCGTSVENIYTTILNKYCLEKITKEGKCYCLYPLEELDYWIQRMILEMIEEEIYALAYAYEKMHNTNEPTQIEILDAKILEMKNANK